MGSFFCRNERAKIYTALLKANHCDETFIMMAPMNAAKSSLVSFRQFRIAIVLRSATLSNILTTIIKTIAVAMINVVWWELQNLPVHQDIFAPFLSARFTAITTYSIKRTVFGIPHHPPIPFRKPSKIRSINDGVLSLCEWDESVRLVEWLGNCVSNYTWFWHESSAKGFVLPGHFTIAGAN